jgi:hypothetical protein
VWKLAHQIQNISTSYSSPENLKIKVLYGCSATPLPSALCGRETVREGKGLREFANRILRRIFGCDEGR